MIFSNVQFAALMPNAQHTVVAFSNVMLMGKAYMAKNPGAGVGIDAPHGIATLQLYPNTSILPAGSRWQIRGADENYNILVNVPAGGIDLGSLIV